MHEYISVTALLTLQCNLACSYCDVDAGPRAKDSSMDLRGFAQCIDAIAALQPNYLAVQLHGGEPLLVDPPIEVFAGVARNILRSHGVKPDLVSAVTNGTLLTAERCESLRRAGIRICVSVDGPAQSHDRHRLNLVGRGSHSRAEGAAKMARAYFDTVPAIAVITEPEDPPRFVRYFIEQGFSSLRLNPIRPQGRATGSASGFFTHVAASYAEVANIIAEHNRRNRSAPMFEDRVSTTVAELVRRRSGEATELEGKPPTFFIRRAGDRSVLTTSAPDFFAGNETKIISSPTPTSLRAALGVRDAPGGFEAPRLTSRDMARCERCRTPALCHGEVTPIDDNTAWDPECEFRSALAEVLESWMDENPRDVHFVCKPSHVRRSSGFAPLPPRRKPAVVDRSAVGSPRVKHILDATRYDGRSTFLCGLLDLLDSMLEQTRAGDWETVIELSNLLRSGALKSLGPGAQRDILTLIEGTVTVASKGKGVAA